MSWECCEADACHESRAAADCAGGGSQLGPACLAALRDNVARLPGLYRDCEERLTTWRPYGLERVRGGMPGGITLDEAAVSARAKLLAVTSSWAGLVADGVAAPRRPRRNMPDLARFLLANLSWLAAHEAARQAAAEFARLVALAEEAIAHRRTTRIELGWCDQVGCEGLVHATVGVTDPSGVRCDRGHQWRTSDWLLLAHRLGRRHDQPGRPGRPVRRAQRGRSPLDGRDSAP